MALEVCGFEKVFTNVGMEPSGDAFNSLIKLENADSTPHNPMINAGAIVIASYLAAEISFDRMLETVQALCMDPEIVLDEKVYRSEMSNISRNRAIAYLLESKGYIGKDVEKYLHFYVKMCSLSVTAESLAGLGLILANDGIHPGTGERLLQSWTVKVVKTIMLPAACMTVPVSLRYAWVFRPRAVSEEASSLWQTVIWESVFLGRHWMRRATVWLASMCWNICRRSCICICLKIRDGFDRQK